MSLQEIRDELFSLIDIKHLLIGSLIFVTLALVIMQFTVFVLVICFGNSSSLNSSPKLELAIAAMYALSAIVILSPFLIYGIIKNYRKKCAAKMNDYIIIYAEVIIASICFYNLLNK